MLGYQELIGAAVDTTDIATIKVVEDIMRAERTALDGLSPAQFTRAARTAYADVIALAGAGHLVEYCEALGLDVPASIVL